MEKNEVVKLENVTKIYKNNSHKTRGVSNINLSAEKGKLLLILGPSGSGKTTIITLAAGLLKPTAGEIFLFNKNIQSFSKHELQRIRAERLGFVFQTFLLIESLTVAENIKLVQKFAGKKNQRSAGELLRQFSIEYLYNSFPSKLSQGEKQRVAVARAVANDADLILADEPTASLESAQGYEIIKLLGRYVREENKCVIVVSHDQRISEFSDDVTRIEDGSLVSPQEFN